MKNSTLFKILVAIFIFSSFSCTKSRESLFEIENEIRLDIPAGLNVLETHFFIIKEVPTFYSLTLAANNLPPDQVASIRSSNSTFTTYFSGINLEFIERIIISGISRDDPTLKKEMFYLENIPRGSKTEINLFGSLSELKYVLDDEFIDLEVQIGFRTFAPSNIDGRIILEYAVFDEE